VSQENTNKHKDDPEADTDESSYDQDLVTKSLGKVGKGASILFIGTVLGIFFNFLARIVIARFYTPEDYGLFNLFFTVLSIFLTLSLLGLSNGIQRFIGYYTGSGEKEKIKVVESCGLLIGTISGVCFGILLFFLAPGIASIFSKAPEFIYYLRIAAITLPFYVLLSSLIAIFRGYQRTKEKVLFYDLGRNTLFLVLSFILGILALPFVGIIWSMFVATAIVAISFFIYYLKKQKMLLKRVITFSFDSSVAKTILIFSLPLLFVNVMHRIMGWTDTVMIGYFLFEIDVGFYNVAKPMSSFISTGLTITNFIYAPLVAGLYAQKKFRENDFIFTALTKWICFLTLPLTMIFFFYSDVVISKSFGVEYLPGTIPLKILVVAYFINNFMGPNGSTLIAYGKTKFLMYATFVSATLNITLNVLLIPIYGIVGAAIATGISILSVNIIRVYKLYSISGVHSFKSNIIKPVISTGIIGSIIMIVMMYTKIPGIIQAIVAFGILSALFLLMLFVTRSVSQQDIKLLILVEKKTGINLSLFKRLLKRFV